MRRTATLAAMTTLALFAACGAEPKRGASAGAGTSSERVVASNLLRADYAGSASCAPCHKDLVARAAKAPMHRMTRRAETAEIKAPFNGATFMFKGFTVTAETRGAARFLRLHRPDGTETSYRVTKVIGGRFREDFVGKEIAASAVDEADADDLEDAHATIAKTPAGANDEPVLPISWLIFEKTWRYKGYSVMATERPRIERGAAWRKTCILCHNTAPLIDGLFDELAGSGSYQGSVTDKLLPPSRLVHFEPIDARGLAAAIADERAFVMGKRSHASEATSVAKESKDAMSAMRARFGEEQLVEVGIGCEACHNGCKEHVANPTRLPSLALASPLLAVTRPAGLPPARERGHDAPTINRVCARCHTVLFTRYGFTWEGKSRDHDPGGSSVSSGEARDFLLGGCASALDCTSCHDPHGEDAQAKLARMATVQGNDTCTRCHDKYAAPGALAAHTHHDVKGEGSACIACHMPKKNLGLAYDLSRYHRIGSPTDRDRVEGDRPLECAICHARSSVKSLTESMEKWWGKSYLRDKLAALYGEDLNVNVLASTLARGKSHERATAAAVLGERGEAKDLALIAPLLTEPIPLVRYWARHAMERLAKAPMPVDLDADPQSITQATNAWVTAHTQR